MTFITTEHCSEITKFIHWNRILCPTGFPRGSDSRESACSADSSTWVQFLGQEDPLEKGLATGSTILAWRSPWTEEPGGLQSRGLHRVRYNWATHLTLWQTCTINPVMQMRKCRLLRAGISLDSSATVLDLGSANTTETPTLLAPQLALGLSWG